MKTKPSLVLSVFLCCLCLPLQGDTFSGFKDDNTYSLNLVNDLNWIHAGLKKQGVSLSGENRA